MTTVKFTYLNHHGKEAARTVDVECLEFQRSPGYGYQPGWFLTGHCHDKDARRSFALSRIILFDLTENSMATSIYRLRLS